MRQRIRRWLYEHFLPKVTKDEYMREMDELRKAYEAVKARNRELEAYIDGVHDCLRARARVEIKNEVSK